MGFLTEYEKGVVLGYLTRTKELRMVLFVQGEKIQQIPIEEFNKNGQTVDVCDEEESRRGDEAETRKAPNGDANDEIRSNEMSKLNQINFDALTENFQKYIESANKTIEKYQEQLREVPKLIEKGLSEMRNEMDMKLKEHQAGGSSSSQKGHSSADGSPDNSSRDEVIKIVRNEMQKLNSSEKQADPSSFLNNIKLIVNKDSSVRRDYKLTNNLKFDHFMDYLYSELRSSDLLYVIDSSIEASVPRDPQTLNNDKFKVRDILINRIDSNYHSKVVHIKDPVELLAKIKELKGSEMSLTSADIRETLHTMKYNPNKQKASDFWDEFDGLVRTHDSIPNVTALSEAEKRDAFYKAVVYGIPSANEIDFMAQEVTSKSLTCEQLKMYIMRQQ